MLERPRLASLWRRLSSPAGALLLVLLARALRWRSTWGALRDYVRPGGNDYLNIAEQVMRGLPMSASRAPLYPCFIALVGSLKLGPPAMSAAGAQVLLSVWAALMVYFLAAALGSPRAGLFAAALLTLNWTFIAKSSDLEVEFFLSLLTLVVAAQYVVWCERGSVKRAFLLAAAIGLCLSARSTFFLFPLFLIGWHQIEPLRSALRAKRLWPLAFSFLALAPWIARNERMSRRFVPFEDGVQYLRVYQASIGEIEALGKTGQVLTEASARFPELRGKTPGEMSRELFGLALRNIEQAPGMFLLGSLRRLFRWLSYAPLLSVLFLCSAGVARRDPAKWAVGAIPVYLAVIHAPLALSDRLILPAIPLLCVLGGCFLDSIAPLLGGSVEPSSPGAGVQLEAAARASLGAAGGLYLYSLAAVFRLNSGAFHP